MGEGFADSNVDIVYPCVEWLVGVDEVGVAIATRSAGTQELEGEDAEGGVSSPGRLSPKNLYQKPLTSTKANKNLQESTSDIIF